MSKEIGFKHILNFFFIFRNFFFRSLKVLNLLILATLFALLLYFIDYSFINKKLYDILLYFFFF